MPMHRAAVRAARRQTWRSPCRGASRIGFSHLAPRPHPRRRTARPPRRHIRMRCMTKFSQHSLGIPMRPRARFRPCSLRVRTHLRVRAHPYRRGSRIPIERCFVARCITSHPWPNRRGSFHRLPTGQRPTNLRSGACTPWGARHTLERPPYPTNSCLQALTMTIRRPFAKDRTQRCCASCARGSGR